MNGGDENAVRWNLPQGFSDFKMPIHHDCYDYTIIPNLDVGVINNDAS